MINFLFCTVLPTGAFKVDQTHKFKDLLDLAQFFPDMTGQRFDRNKSCQKRHYEQF